MRTATKYDYKALRQTYITSDVSLRALCRDAGIENAFSTVAARARREGWDEDRSAYRAVEKNKVFETIAETRARKLAEIDKDSLEVIHAAILQVGVSLTDRTVNGQVVPAMQVSVGDLVKLIDKIQMIQGRPTQYTREEHFGLSFSGDAGDLPAEILRDLASIARAKGAGAGPVGHSALPGIEGARKVN